MTAYESLFRYEWSTAQAQQPPRPAAPERPHFSLRRMLSTLWGAANREQRTEQPPDTLTLTLTLTVMSPLTRFCNAVCLDAAPWDSTDILIHHAISAALAADDNHPRASMASSTDDRAATGQPPSSLGCRNFCHHVGRACPLSTKIALQCATRHAA